MSDSIDNLPVVKRTPLKRKTPLQRKPPKRRRTRKNSYRLRRRYPEYMKWVRRQPCIVRELPPPDDNDWTAYDDWDAFIQRVKTCSGEIQADHMGRRAMGRKAHDSTCAAMCANHHDQKTNGWGLFWGLTLASKRAWRQAAIERTQANARKQGVEVPEDDS